MLGTDGLQVTQDSLHHQELPIQGGKWPCIGPSPSIFHRLCSLPETEGQGRLQVTVPSSFPLRASVPNLGQRARQPQGKSKGRSLQSHSVASPRLLTSSSVSAQPAPLNQPSAGYQKKESRVWSRIYYSKKSIKFLNHL